MSFTEVAEIFGNTGLEGTCWDPVLVDFDRPGRPEMFDEPETSDEQ